MEPGGATVPERDGLHSQPMGSDQARRHNAWAYPYRGEQSPDGQRQGRQWLAGSASQPTRFAWHRAGLRFAVPTNEPGSGPESPDTRRDRDG